MSLIKWNESTLPLFNTWVDNFFNSNENLLSGTNGGLTIPAVNVTETDEAFELELAAPGKKKEDFIIEIENGILSISSEKEQKDETKDKNYTRKEYSYEGFKRSFTLPENVKEDNIEATYNEGVLGISIPKTSVSKPISKTIEVS